MAVNQGLASEFELTTAPEGTVVEIDALRKFCDYYETDEDCLIDELYNAAVERIESESGRQLLTATWELHLPWFPNVIKIRKCPVSSISSITYVDLDGDTQTLATSVYDTFLLREPAEIRLAYQQCWPSTRDQEQAVTVTFVAGYGGASDVPAIVKTAIKLMVRDGFNGCDSSAETVNNLMSQIVWGM